MPGPARAGALIYAKDLGRVSVFYQRVLGMQPLKSDAEHHVLESADMQLIIHLIPAQYAAEIEITSPPEPRTEQAIKLFFTVDSLAGAEATAASLGGKVFGPTYPVLGFVVRNAFDPEGNIFQLRAFIPSV